MTNFERMPRRQRTSLRHCEFMAPRRRSVFPPLWKTKGARGNNKGVSAPDARTRGDWLQRGKSPSRGFGRPPLSPCPSVFVPRKVARSRATTIRDSHSRPVSPREITLSSSFVTSRSPSPSSSFFPLRFRSVCSTPLARPHRYTFFFALSRLIFIPAHLPSYANRVKHLLLVGDILEFRSSICRW